MSGEVMFSRRCRVLVDTLQVDGLRVQFEVTKTLTKHPNTCDIKISNLSEHTRKQMKKRRAKVILLAGYEDTVAQIFSGTARTTDHVREGAEWVTHIQCGDGEVAFKHARVSQSFSSGATVSGVVTGIANSLGLGAGNVQEQLSAGGFRGNIEQFAQGYVAHGNSSTELSKVLDTAGFEWSIQDGALQILKPGKTSKRQAILLSPDSGLVGSPELGAPNKKGKPSVMKAKSLLQPGLIPGGEVAIKARSVDGHFRLEKVKHTGDTAGGNWYSEIEGHPL